MNKKHTEMIRELLQKKGIERRKHASTMAEILGIKYQSAKQKLDEKRGITFAEMKKMYCYFNMSFDNIKSHNGIFIMHDMHVRCNVEVDPYAVEFTLPNNNYAIKKNNLYIVDQRNNDSDEQKYKVIKIDFLPAPRLAILDNDNEILELLNDLSNRLGVDAHTFTTKDKLLDSFKENNYDCYIIDWLLDYNQTSESIIKEIRESNNNIPVILLTGQLNQREHEVGDAIIKYGVELIEKPTRTYIISSILISNLFY